MRRLPDSEAERHLFMGSAPQDQHLSFAYSKREELERKRALQILYSRAEEQIIVSLAFCVFILICLSFRKRPSSSTKLVRILSSYQQIMHEREAAMKLHIGDIFLDKFPPSKFPPS